MHHHAQHPPSVLDVSLSLPDYALHPDCRPLSWLGHAGHMADVSARTKAPLEQRRLYARRVLEAALDSKAARARLAAVAALAAKGGELTLVYRFHSKAPAPFKHSRRWRKLRLQLGPRPSKGKPRTIRVLEATMVDQPY